MALRRMTPQEIEWLNTLTEGNTDSKAGRHKRAIKHLEQAQSMAIRFNLSAEEILQTNMYYGIALDLAGENARAEVVYRRALENAAKTGCERTPVYAVLHAELGMLIFKKRKFDESRLLFEKYTDLHDALKVEIQEDYLYIQICLCVCYLEAHEWSRAERLSRNTHAKSIRLLGEINMCSRQSKYLHDFAVSQLNSTFSHRRTGRSKTRPPH